MLFRILALVLTSLALSGCASSQSSSARAPRPFDFSRDTFGYPNGLVWEYHFDDAGRRTVRRREPASSYTHHCFVVVRSARQFFKYARFDPTQPRCDEETYRGLIRRVISLSSRGEIPEANKVIIPGYADLREFSLAQEHLLQAACGGAWRSYFQRGHWRMIFPFSRSHQERIANQLTKALAENRPPVVHLACFPSLAINHAVLVFHALETDTKINFSAYDPNNPEQHALLTYDRRTRTFYYPRNPYFAGGPVDVYQIYHAWNY
jgi:hypothetical protein